MKVKGTQVIPLCLGMALGVPKGAVAADWYTGAVANPSADWLVAVDSSVTVTSTGSAFASTSGTFAVDGNLAQSGARVRVEGLGGRYEYKLSSNRVTVVGEQAEGSVLAGYEWIEANRAVSAYLGVSARDNSISVPDPTNAIVGTKVGVKVAVSGYAEPTRDTMVFGYASYSSAYNAFYGRAKFGYDIGGRVFVGPEVAALGDDAYRQWRAGLHVTGLKAGVFQLSASGGYLRDERQGSGAYVTLDARAQF